MRKRASASDTGEEQTGAGAGKGTSSGGEQTGDGSGSSAGNRGASQQEESAEELAKREAERLALLNRILANPSNDFLNYKGDDQARS